jgi:cysteine sulfinate desulfinase/cysteine desulfurase-like protein
MGLSEERVNASLRFSLGRSSHESAIDRAAAAVAEALRAQNVA